ncbi:glutamate receptor ionotropic, kainate 2 isoform X3 [Diorhabda carinulata]|uniref:glutamate receptor ionotropic, kainate 2 isoform X3 n=1 Tax=Diorhabda sublineata TaxID=1163346 RepID=UPI0024E1028C|nr:glutamate receptor ionotropic, kainate 2 isoform X3 [Diorhabda sublineata]XP_057665406.1 glutamate receptor ionotropic, kainate 2 isoform X3 [Diorhabda carinulata]
MHIVTLISLLLWSNFGYAGLPPVIRIGAIFTEDQKNSSVELAFKYAVYKINKERDLLPNTTLVYDIQYVPRDDSFRTSKKACRQVEFGVQAIFGPSDPILGAHIQSICEALDVPHIEARVDFEPTSKELSINLHPSQESMNKAFKDLMAFLNWTKVAIIYEEDYGLFKLQELVKAPGAARTEMYIRQAGPGSYRQVLREVRQKELYKLIVDTNPRNINQFFRAILQLQMNDYRYHYMFTTFDLETFDLEDFKYNSVNITAFRVVDVDHPKVKETLEVMEKFQPIGHAILNRSGVIQAEPALMFDSVYVFAKGLSGMENMQSIRPTNLSCDIEKPWDDGLTLYDYIDSVSGLHGLTGNLEFSEGKRTNFKVDLLKLKKEEIRKVGEWTVTNGINITDPNAFYENHTPNVTLIVMTREERPYVMVNEEKNLTGNARYEGFCIDLLKWIAAQVGFQYTIRLVPDHMYGVFDPDTKEWNGIVRELMEKRADLAVASMTINYARESVIDFTKPFMNLGIGILFKVPTSQPTRLFSFMNPLAVEIWLYVLAAYILVSFTLFVMARFSPYEWNNPHPCHQDSDIVENQFSVSNSFWFITGTFLRQGSGLNPKATSTRIVGGIWWFFTLIIISSYTANLAAFLTVERMITPIESAQDLAEQTEIAYGTLEGGSTMTFFRDSKIGIYQKMWRFMESRNPPAFVKSYEDGVKRVLEGDYAFLMESTMLDYAVQRDCNLTQIGGLLDSKGYGIATPKGSPWRDKISLAILELQEKGVIQILYDKWWKNTGDVCTRDDKSKESKANALGVENIGGVFVVLLCGLALAILVAILEFCWNSKKNAQTDRQSLCSEMAEELRFAVRCHGSRQRPALRRSCTRCSPATTYVPAALDLPHLNGEGVMLPMLDVKRSPINYEVDT